MKIKSISYKNSAQKWSYEKIDFFDLTLLVGLSGAGKTQILHSILDLKDLAKGKSKNGIEWQIEFSIAGSEYLWRGKTKHLQKQNTWIGLFRTTELDSIPFWEEELQINGKSIATRKNEQIEFAGQKMPKLSQTESLLSIFKEEEVIKAATKAFHNIQFRDQTTKPTDFTLWVGVDLRKDKSRYSSIEKIRESELNIYDKLYYTYENFPDVFDEIKKIYAEIFPNVIDVRIEPFENRYNTPDIYEQITVIQIKERNVSEWIPHTRMSSGMLRTLLHISDMYLSPNGTVILIDEFENSLGVNCIDYMIEDLVYENNRLQFIATSHHPYIINKIPYEFWKIVSRIGGNIKVNNATEFRLGDSKHDRFLNLVNLPLFRQKAS